MNNTIDSRQQQNITLYHREGSSDKVYQCSIEPHGEGFVVNFAFGRRGTTLQTGTKTPMPVDLVAATWVFNRLVQEKKSKGYTEGPDGTPYQHSDNGGRATDVLPQLLNAIPESEVQRLIADPHYCAQEKHDGCRILIQKNGDGVTGINRRGLVIGLPEPILQSAKTLPGEFIIDGESVGDRYHAFDLLESNGRNLRSYSYQLRLAALMNLVGSGMQRHIRLTHTAFATAQKRDLFNWLRRENREGIVFKRLDAKHTPGRPHSGGAQLKHKFYATVSAVVANVNDRRSIEVRLLNGEGWISCGNVTIPVNLPVPETGEVVEIRYLYAFRESHALYQSVYLGLREDIEYHECRLSQLKYKSDEEPQ